MSKRKLFWILYVLLVLMLVGIAVCMLVIGDHEDNRNTSEELEKLKDQLKVYVSQSLPPETETERSEESEKLSETSEAPEETETPEHEINDEYPEESESETEISENISVMEESETIEETAAEETEPITEEAFVPSQIPSDMGMLLDFNPLWKVNPDVSAWIEIEGTKVDYPVLQSPDNDSKYLNTALDGSYYIGGSLFTQAAYNSNDFNDPVTVIYGHTMRSGTLFGQLQSTYSDKDSFSEHSEIKLYLPDEVRYYTVFAAVPYSNIHVLDTYDFSKVYWYKKFFDGVKDIREFGAQFCQDSFPQPGDRVIILSTCLNEDSTRRYLVMAICQDDIQ